MDPDTLGPGGGRFPATRRSILLAARDADPEVRRRALDTLIASYWKDLSATSYEIVEVIGRGGMGTVYLEIMLPGCILGVVVGYATQRYGGRRPATASAH